MKKKPKHALPGALFEIYEADHMRHLKICARFMFEKYIAWVVKEHRKKDGK
jgi:hypothetical protein